MWYALILLVLQIVYFAMSLLAENPKFRFEFGMFSFVAMTGLFVLLGVQSMLKDMKLYDKSTK